MRHRNRPAFKQTKTPSNRNGWFSIMPIFPQLVAAIIVFIAYYYIQGQNLFPDRILYIYWGMKIFIALQILIAARRSLVGSLLAGALGLLDIYLISVNGVALLTSDDALQLIIAAGVGVLFTLLIKFLKL